MNYSAALSCLLVYALSQSVGGQIPMNPTCDNFGECQSTFTNAAQVQDCWQMRDALNCMYRAWGDCAQDNRQPVPYQFLSSRAATVQAICDSEMARNRGDDVMMASDASLMSAPVLLLVVFHCVLAMLLSR